MIKLLLPLLLLSGCVTVPAVERFRYKGIDWICEMTIQRMNCHNTAIETRYVQKRPINPREF